MDTVSFTEHHMRMFLEASGDANPIHLSDIVARRGGHPSCVVYGVLAVLVLLGKLVAKREGEIHTIDIEFHRPMYLGTEYQSLMREHGVSRTSVELLDSGQKVLTMRVAFKSILDRQKSSEIPSDATTNGCYLVSSTPFTALRQELFPRLHDINVAHIQCLLCISYLVGMEMPGPGALLARISAVFSDQLETKVPLGADYVGKQTGGPSTQSLGVKGKMWCRITAEELLTCISWIAIPQEKESRDLTTHRSIQGFTGQVAVVTGGSRGLGAAIVQHLAVAGADVYLNYLSDEEQAEEVQRNCLTAPGRVILIKGDAGSPSIWAHIRAQIEQVHGRLDLLVCCATPPIQSLPTSDNSLAKASAFVSKSFEIGVSPILCMRDLLRKNNSVFCFTSSAYIVTSQRRYGHYIAAKLAVEGFLNAIAPDMPEVSMIAARIPRIYRHKTQILPNLAEVRAHPDASLVTDDRLAERLLTTCLNKPIPGKLLTIDVAV